MTAVESSCIVWFFANRGFAYRVRPFGLPKSYILLNLISFKIKQGFIKRNKGRPFISKEVQLVTNLHVHNIEKQIMKSGFKPENL